MAREIPQYISQLNIGSMPQVQFSTAQGEATMRASAQLGAVAEDMQQKTNQIEKLKASTTLRENLYRMAEENKANPEGLKSAVDGYKKGFIGNIKNSTLAEEFEITYNTEALPYIDRATDQYRKNLDEEHESVLIKSQAQNIASFGQIIPNLNSPIPEVKQSALAAVDGIFKQSAEIASTKKSDGSYMFTPQQQLAMAMEGGKQLISAMKPEQRLEVLGDGIGGFQSAMNNIEGFEVSAKSPDMVNSDGDGTKAYRGINSAANPTEFAKIEQLLASGKTLEARAIADKVYKEKYWDAIDGDSIPVNAQGIIMDAAVNQGVSYALMLKEKVANGATPSELIEMRRERYSKTKGTPQEKLSWERRLSSFEHLTLGDHLGLMDTGTREAIKEGAYREIEADIKLYRENPVMAATKRGLTSVEQVVELQTMRGTAPEYAKVIENEQAKAMVEKLNQSQSTDDVVQFAQGLQQQYGGYFKNAVADLKAQGKMKPELEGALSLSLRNNPNFKTQIDVLTEVGRVGSDAVKAQFTDNRYKPADLKDKLMSATEEWKAMMVAEGQNPDTSILEAMVMGKMNQDLTGDYDSAIEWAMTPDAQNYKVAELNGAKYRVPTMDAQGNALDASAIESRLDDYYTNNVLPKLKEAYQKKGFVLNEDMIAPYLNDAEDGLYFKVGTESLADENGNKLTISFKDVVTKESSQERLDRIRKELEVMPYGEREAYRKKAFGFK